MNRRSSTHTLYKAFFVILFTNLIETIHYSQIVLIELRLDRIVMFWLRQFMYNGYLILVLYYINLLSKVRCTWRLLWFWREVLAVRINKRAILLILNIRWITSWSRYWLAGREQITFGLLIIKFEKFVELNLGSFFQYRCFKCILIIIYES